MADSKTIAFSGGEATRKVLKNIQLSVMASPQLNVGFLEDATYDDGTPVAYIAMIQEYGATINQPARQHTIFKKTNKQGTKFLRKGKFVKASQANFSQVVNIPAHTIVIPPRPFFRTMIKDHKSEWGPLAAQLLRENNYQIILVANLMGMVIKGQLQESITNWTSPPNAPSTIRGKGFDKPLIDTGFMKSRVDYNIE